MWPVSVHATITNVFSIYVCVLKTISVTGQMFLCKNACRQDDWESWKWFISIHIYCVVLLYIFTSVIKYYNFEWSKVTSLFEANQRLYFGLPRHYCLICDFWSLSKTVCPRLDSKITSMWWKYVLQFISFNMMYVVFIWGAIH